MKRRILMSLVLALVAAIGDARVTAICALSVAWSSSAVDWKSNFSMSVPAELGEAIES